MKKTIIDEHTGWEYELIGNQYYPTGRVQKNGVMTPETVEPEETSVGIWGQRHAEYLKNNQRGVYIKLFVSGKLQTYLDQIDRDAKDMFDMLVCQLAEQECITEQLKAENQRDWVKKMNSIRNRAVEIVNHELIYV